MSLDIGKKAINAVFRSAIAHNYKKIRLKYAGGEPTLVFPSIIELHEYANVLGAWHDIELSGVVLSNGVTLSDKIIQGMIEKNLALAISLDGMGQTNDIQRPLKNGTGSFERVSKNIERVCQAGLMPHISIVVSARNIGGLPDLVAWILEKELSFSISFYRENAYSASFEDLQFDEQKMIKGMMATFKVIEYSLPKQNLLGALVDKANLAIEHKHTCAVGKNYFVIDHHGRVAKCQMEIDNPITTIDHQDPLKIVQTDKISVQNLHVEEKEGCHQCEWKNWCTGGCPVVTYRATGRYDLKSPNCNRLNMGFRELCKQQMQQGR